jgi:hypothetical protein
VPASQALALRSGRPASVAGEVAPAARVDGLEVPVTLTAPRPAEQAVQLDRPIPALEFEPRSCSKRASSISSN